MGAARGGNAAATPAADMSAMDVGSGPRQDDRAPALSEHETRIAYPSESNSIQSQSGQNHKAPGLVRAAAGVSQIQTIPEEEGEAPVEVAAQERLSSLSSRKHPKSPRKPKSNSSSKSSLHVDSSAAQGGGSKWSHPQKSPRPVPAPAPATGSSRTRGQSSPSRRTRAEEDELQDVLAEIIRDQTLTLARTSRRQGKPGASSSSVSRLPSSSATGAGAGTIGTEDKIQGQPLPPPPPPLPPLTAAMTGRTPSSSSRAAAEVVELHEESLVKGGPTTTTTRRGTKPRRQQLPPKRRVDAVHESALLPDELSSVVSEQSDLSSLPPPLPPPPPPGFRPLQGLQHFVSRVTSRKGDVIMWRDVPRSALLFGAGCFCILSTSFVRDVRCGALTVTSYMALVYLGAVFLHRNFLRGGASQQHAGKKWELCETDALELLRLCLPAINMMLRKCGELFGGDPATTLKVASILWMLAQTGYFMTIWSFVRLAFLLAFLLPKLYVCYSHQLHSQAEAYADRLVKAWSAYAHKKVAVFIGLVLVWNLSSAAFRLYGAFLFLVIIKLYSRYLAEQAEGIEQQQQAVPTREPVEERRLYTPPRHQSSSSSFHDRFSRKKD